MNTIWLTSKFNPVKIRDKEELDGNDKSYFFLRNLSKLPLTFQEFWTLTRVFFKFVVLIVSFLTSSNHIAGNIYFLWELLSYRWVSWFERRRWWSCRASGGESSSRTWSTSFGRTSGWTGNPFERKLKKGKIKKSFFGR